MNNLLSKIAVNIKNLGKAKLDFSHAFSTTASFGDLQPIHCKIIQPNSNGKIEGKALVRLSTMLAPTFGKVKVKEYHHFVPASDLFECVAPMLAQSKYTADGSGVMDCKHFPRMTLGLLSRMILIGARFEIFQHPQNTSQTHSKYIEKPKSSGAINRVINDAQIDGFVSWTNGVFNDNDWFKFNADNPNVNGVTTNRVSGFDGFHGTWFNLGKLNLSWFQELNGRYTPPDNLVQNPDFWIPIANNDGPELFGYYKEEFTDTDGTVKIRFVSKHFNFEKCDGCIDFKVGSHEYTLAFYLSSFGKRIRKQIIGSGKQINMCSYTSHEIVTLCAIWKAYFDLFAITQYENYEITPLRLFTRYVDTSLKVYNQSSGELDPNIDSIAYNDRFVDFIMALGRMWYTEPQSAVGAMLTSTAVSPSLGLSKEFIDVDGVSHVTEVDTNSFPPGQPIGLNGHAFIDAIKHGQLDANYLQKLYKWTNIHSVVGQAIEERLRAEGLGKYIRSCKSNFIGFSEELIDISDVVSTSDTYNNASGDGRMLGSQGGRGIKLYKTKDASYSTDEIGVAIALLTIVPEADFLRSIDPQSYTIKKTDFILPEFDGMGFEPMRKTLLNGAIDWSSQLAIDNQSDFDSIESVVGLLPRGTHLKLAHALNNGDITLRSTIDGYLPYTLDKYMKVGDYEGHKDFDNGNYETWTLYPTMRPADVPVGGYHYRFTCRFPWLGNFTRIFAINPDLLDTYFFYAYAINAQSTQLGFELTHAEFDNFIVHGLITAPVWSPCKPISESFETTLEGEKPNASFEHA